MPWTTGFTIFGALSISFPLFCGFVSKSIIITEVARQGHTVIWIVLIFASAGVFHQAGIKIPFFTFFAKDSGLRPKEAPLNMLIAMALVSFLCLFMGCNPQWLYSLLPNGAAGYNPYDATHIITQFEILLFTGLSFLLLRSWGRYPPEVPSINLDIDWIYRKAGRWFLDTGEWFWNGLNDRSHALFVAGITDRVCLFLKQGHVYTMKILFTPMSKLGLLDAEDEKGEAHLGKRTSLGVHPVGWTALACMIFFLGFLLLVFQ